MCCFRRMLANRIEQAKSGTVVVSTVVIVCLLCILCISIPPDPLSFQYHHRISLDLNTAITTISHAILRQYTASRLLAYFGPSYPSLGLHDHITLPIVLSSCISLYSRSFRSHSVPSYLQRSKSYNFCTQDRPLYNINMDVELHTYSS